jgi:hypothetical protein
MNKSRISDINYMIEEWKLRTNVSRKEALFALYDDRFITANELDLFMAPIMGL